MVNYLQTSSAEPFDHSLLLQIRDGPAYGLRTQIDGGSDILKLQIDHVAETSALSPEKEGGYPLPWLTNGQDQDLVLGIGDIPGQDLDHIERYLRILGNHLHNDRARNFTDSHFLHRDDVIIVAVLLQKNAVPHTLSIVKNIQDMLLSHDIRPRNLHLSAAYNDDRIDAVIFGYNVRIRRIRMVDRMIHQSLLYLPETAAPPICRICSVPRIHNFLCCNPRAPSCLPAPAKHQYLSSIYALLFPDVKYPIR